MKARKKSTPVAKARRKEVKKPAAGKAKAGAKKKLPGSASVNKRGKAGAAKRGLIPKVSEHGAELQSRNVEIQRSRTDLEMALRSYAELYDCAPAGYLSLDRTGTITQANLTAAVLLGCERERLVGGHLALFLAEADRVRLSNLLKDVFATRKRQSCEVELLAKHQPALVVHMEATVSPDGRQCKAVLVDVTALAQGRLALRESEERYRAVLQDQSEVIARFSADNTFTFVNDAFCRLFGKTSAELIGRVWQPVAVADDLPMIMERLRRLSPRNSTVVIENRVYSGTGEIRWMQFVNRAFFDKAGRLVETQTVGRDVTERKLAEEALRESEERWKFALEGAGDGVWDWDVVTNHVVFSKRWKSMIGYEDNEIPNHFDEWAERLHPDDLSGAMAKVNALFDGSVPAYICEFRMKCKDGSWKWILARGTVTSRDGRGRPLRAIGTHTDISGRKAAEEREARNLKLISEGASCAAVLDAIVRSLEAGHPGMACSVMLVGPGRRHLVVGAAPSLPDFFCKALKGLIIGPDAACSGTAVYTRKRVIVEDVLDDARWAPFAKLAARAKLRSCWAEPLIGHKGQMLGAFVCYHRQPHLPAPAEIAAVTAAAHLAAVAIEREAAEHALREGEERYRRIVQTSAEGVWTIDAKARTDFVNPKMAEMLGYTVEEMLGRHLDDFMDEEGRAIATNNLKRRKRGIAETHEFKFLRKDRSTIWTLMSTSPINDAQGHYLGALAMVTDITERKAAEAALLESEERYRLIVHTAEEGIWRINAESLTDYVNPKMARMMGYTPEEMLGRPIDDFLDDEGRADLVTLIERRKSGIGEQFEFKYLRKDGSKLWAFVSTNPITNASGVYVGAVALLTDIRARKEAEAALLESEERYRLLAENTDDMVSLTDTKGHRLYLSPSYFRKTGWTQEDLLSRDWRTRVHPDDVETVEAARKENLAGTATRIEHRTSCRDGSWLWIEASCKPLFDSKGKVWRLLVWSHDITARQEAETAVRESEERFRSVFEQAAVGVAIIDSNTGRFVDANQRHCEITCLTREQTLAATFRDITHPEDRQVDAENMKKLRAGTVRTLNVEKRYVHPDGAITWVNVTASPMWKPGEEPTTHIAVVEDITRRKLVEDALRVSEEKFRTLFENAGDAVFIMEEGRFVDCNTRALEMFGCESRDQFVGHPPYEFSPARQPDGSDSQELAREKIRSTRAGYPQIFEWMHQRHDGTPFPAEVSLNIVKVRDRALLQAFVRDISVRKQAEQLLEWEKSAMELIGSGASLHEVLDELMLGLEKQLPGALCSVLLLDEDGTHVRHGAAPSLPEAYNRAIDGLPIGPATGSCGTAAYTGRQVIVSDIDTDPLWTDYREVALGHGLRACWSTPMIGHEGKVLGTFAIYYREPREPRPTELDLVGRAVHVTRIAIERKQAAEALRKSEQKFRAIFEQAAVGVAMIDSTTGRFLGVNQRHCDIARLTREQILSETFMNITHPADLQADLENMEKLKAGVIPTFAMEKRYLHPDGEITWINLTVSPMWRPGEAPTTHIAVVEDITARKKAEFALLESQERYRAIVASSTDYILRYDRDGRHLFGNPATLKFTGLTVEQFVGKTHRELGYPAHLCDLWEKKIEHVFSTGDSVTIEFEVEGVGGKADLELKLSPEFAADGSVCGVVGMSRDVTKRKRAEVALHESEERYARAMRGSNDGLWDWFIPSRELYLSPRWKELLGFADHEIPNVEESFFTRIHPGDAERVQDAINAHLEQHEPYDVELRLQTKSGGYRWVRARGEVEWDDNGRATHMAGTITDITERKLAQERFAVEQEFKETLVAHTSALIVVLNERSNVLHINPAFVKELGYELSELAGRPLWESGMMGAAEIPRAQERYRRLTEGLANPPTEVRLRAKNGDWHVVELTSIATRHPDNSIDRIILTCTDITERTRLQHEVLKISEQEQASIGHNLHDGVGQTMTGIASMLEHLESTLTGDQQKIAARIRELMQDSIAEVRRMSHGLSPVSVQLRGLAGGLQLLAETIRTNYRAGSTCEVDPGIDIKDAEKETHLYRIAQEAINNALRHGKAKQVNIALKRVSDTECALQIEDDGSGIKPGKKGKGNGVGLRVMQYRAGLIGGEVNVISRLPSGVGIVCRFPCDCAPLSKNAKRNRSV